jgi:hypothetical protein
MKNGKSGHYQLQLCIDKAAATEHTPPGVLRRIPRFSPLPGTLISVPILPEAFGSTFPKEQSQ